MTNNKLAVILAAACVLLTGCCNKESAESERPMTESGIPSKRFEFHAIGDPWADRDLIVDTETGCCYLFVKDGNGAGMCQLTDEHGAPLIWEGHDEPK